MIGLPSGAFKLNGATEEPLKVGDQAPDFENLDENGKKLSLADFKGSPVVIAGLDDLRNSDSGENLRKVINLGNSLDGVVDFVVISANYYLENQKLWESTGKKEWLHFIDDNSLNYVATETYNQPTENGFVMPVYVVDGEGKITAIEHDMTPEKLAQLMT